ncbi:MAG TPA: hypothetical protein VHM27_15865 [Rhizomicrobium sp.]|jgi:hypothetical protein|nr:hypothetical protein [Rhizomicrobium sp.]
MRLLTAFAASFLLASPAFAHHGWSGQEEKVTELTGTVTKGVSLAGPHAEMQIKVGNDLWDVTLAPPARTSAAGLKPGLIPVGATVTIRGNKSTEPGHREMKTILVIHGNTRYAVYPERN